MAYSNLTLVEKVEIAAAAGYQSVFSAEPTKSWTTLDARQREPWLTRAERLWKFGREMPKAYGRPDPALVAFDTTVLVIKGVLEGGF
jgi:hypothetical protein